LAVAPEGEPNAAQIRATERRSPAPQCAPGVQALEIWGAPSFSTAVAPGLSGQTRESVSGQGRSELKAQGTTTRLACACGSEVYGSRPSLSSPAGRRLTSDSARFAAFVFARAHVVAVAAGDRPGERDAPAVYEQVVLAARPAAIDGARTRLGAPFFACR
jgi:hypothetical protein